VRGFLDLGDRASVAAIEVVPAILHDQADVERELGAAIAAFAEKGPSPAELAAVKAQLRARLQGEEKRAGTTAEPRDVVLARVARTAERAEAVTADDLRALVKRVFSPAHEVVVTTTPRG
jgi:predicted Zn-dependent peptidase